jgi:hypothetical protein
VNFMSQILVWEMLEGSTFWRRWGERASEESFKWPGARRPV